MYFTKMGAHLIKGEIIYNNDIINLVLENINYGSVWKSIRSVSKNIYYLSRKYQRSKLIELANPILSLIYLFPSEGWDIIYILSLGSISIDFIRLTYNRIHWTKYIISMSSKITINDVINADPDSIDWEILSRNSSIKVSDMLKYDYLPWNYYFASTNTSIRIEDVKDNLDKEWSSLDLSLNSSLSIEDLSTIMNLSEYSGWLLNKNTTYEDVIKYMNTGSYNFMVIKYILLNENILQSYIDRYPNIELYNIYKQSISPNIIKNNPQFNWDYIIIDYSKFTVEEIMNIPVTSIFSEWRILEHPDFTIKDFFKYFDVNTFTNWNLLSNSPWLTFDIVLEYKDDIPWDHYGLSRNPNVTVDILEDSDFSWIEWNYWELSEYAQLNWIYIIEHINKPWAIRGLSGNKSLMR